MRVMTSARSIGSAPGLVFTTMFLVLRRLPFGERLEIGETVREILADHLVHVDEDAHHLPDEEIGAVHGPCDGRGLAFRLHRERGGVVSFERPEEIQLDDDLGGWRYIRNLHAPLADVLVAIPFIYGALAACRAAVCSLHRGVFLLVGRPIAPAAQVVDEREDLL